MAFGYATENTVGMGSRKGASAGRTWAGSRVLIFSLHYKPEPNFIVTDVAEAWAGEGHRVTVVTVHPNYPKGQFYPGTKPWRIARTNENGVIVWRIPYYTDHSLSPLRRTLSYLSYAIAAALLAPLIARRPSVVWVYHGPFMTAVPALFFKWVHRAKLIYTCADLWPESLVATGVRVPSFLIRSLFAYRRWINRQADVLVCSTRGTAEIYAAEGVSRDRLEYVPVWVEGISAEPSPTGCDTGSDVPTIVYAGNLGPAQPVETLIRAGAILRREGTTIKVHIFGSGSREKELKKIALEEDAQNVVFHGRVTPDMAFDASARATGQVVLLASSPMFRMSVPSKLAFCFAASSPLLFGLEGESVRIAEEAGGGIAFSAEDPQSLVLAIRNLIALTSSERDAMRVRLRDYYERGFARGTLIERYVALLRSSDTE